MQGFVAAPAVQPPAPQRGIGRRAARLRRQQEAEGRRWFVVPAPDDREKPWIASAREPYTTRALTEDEPRAPAPPGFKGRLFPPQATTLAAMLDLEKRQTLPLHYGTDEHKGT